MLTAGVSCISYVYHCRFPSCLLYLTRRHPETSGRVSNSPSMQGSSFLEVATTFSVYILLFKILFQQVFISLSSLFRKHGSFFFCSFMVFSSLLVQFTSVCVPSETLSKWSLNSSLIFILRNCLNLRAARFRKAASFVSSHRCFLKKFGSLFGQSLSVPVILSSWLMLIISTLPKALPSLSLMWQSDDVTGSSTRIRGGIPKIYLKETWNMVCGRWV